MRCRLLWPLAGIAALLAAGGAQAGTLTSATWLTEWRSFGSGPQVSFTVPVTASGTSTATSASVSLSIPSFSSSMTVTGVALQSPAVTLTLDGMQQLTATAGMAAASTGIPGAETDSFGTMNLTLLRVPLRVGVDALFTGTFTVLGQMHSLTVSHYAWTPGTRTFTGLTFQLSPLPDVTAMGSFALNANGGGTVTLVSPTRITSRGPTVYETDVSLTTLTLHFVPEPGTLLLLGAAAVALGTARRSKRAS